MSAPLEQCLKAIQSILVCSETYIMDDVIEKSRVKYFEINLHIESS